MTNADMTDKAAGLRPGVTASICALAEKYAVEKVILFGSRAKGSFKRASDIDLAVSGGDFCAFVLDVDEKTPTLLQYDFVNLDTDVSPALLEEILRDGKIIYEKAPLRAE